MHLSINSYSALLNMAVECNKFVSVRHESESVFVHWHVQTHKKITSYKDIIICLKIKIILKKFPIIIIWLLTVLKIL